MLERKSEIWLESKFGYEGSIYDTFKGKIKLERYTSEVPRKYSGNITLSNYLGTNSSRRVLEVISEDEEEDNGEERKSMRRNFTPHNDNSKKSMSVELNNKALEDKNPEEVKKELEEAKSNEIKRILSLEYTF